MSSSRSGFAALFFVYLVWGSSFLAIRMALNGAQAFQPFGLAATRTLGAGVLLLLLGLARGERLHRAALTWLSLTGLLLWVGGHALMIWGERRMESSLAALIFAASPLWAALLEGIKGKGLRVWPLVTGFLGVALVLPLSKGLETGIVVDALAVLASAFFWALGTVLGNGPAAGVGLALASGVQLVVAGLVTAVWAYLAGESFPAPALGPLLACLHLTLIGTVLAYLAYAHAQRTLPVAWVMSFGYVSPMVAVVLGAVALGETLNVRTGIGMGLVVASVIWLFSARAPA